MQKRKFTHKPSKYLEAFLNLKCNTDLQILDVFPNIKEITESMAMSVALWQLGFDRKREDVTVICVGDGCTPRTGALLAHLSKHTVVSVDPKMRLDAKYSAVQRLHVINRQIEDRACVLDLYIAATNVVIVACHSHASLSLSVGVILRSLPKTIGVVSMSCCKKDDLSVMPDTSYVDHAVWSPKNIVRIWEPRTSTFWHNVDPVLGAQ